MKKYQKPQVVVAEFSVDQNMASLSEWLDENGLKDAGITTYHVVS